MRRTHYGPRKEKLILGSAQILDGRTLARQIRTTLQEQITDFERDGNFRPALRVLLVGEQEDSVLYAQNIVRWFTKLGLGCSLVTLPEDASLETVQAEVEAASADSATHGLLIQMPLPSHLPALSVLSALNPRKDVEGLHPENVGLLASGQPRLVPSTPLAGLELLDAYGIELEGRDAVIIGRSNVVGKPLAQLLLARNATVSVLHSATRDLRSYVGRADIVAAATGRAGLVTGAMLKPGAVVLDFGINFVDGAVVGDVVFEECVEIASSITPVPGGIGPLTNLMLARNLLSAARLQL